MEKSKRILWVNPAFLDYRVPLYAEMKRQSGDSFHLIYSRERVPDRCDAATKAALGEKAHSLEGEKRYRFGVKDFANTGIQIPVPKGLYRAIKGVKPDMIITEGYFQFTPWALWYAFWHRKPLYLAYERTAHTERNCPLWRRLYRKFVNLFMTGYIANGIQTKEYLVSQGVKPEKIFTEGMCADSKGLAEGVARMGDEEKTAFRKEIVGDNRGGLLYVIVGQITNRKGVKEALAGWEEHVKKYPDDRVLLLGDGPLLEGLREKYASEPSVIFKGKVDYREIYRYYAVADVFLIATLEDNWSLVVPEAMACGLPIACSIYNGCHPELVHRDVNGTTFDPLRRGSIVEALEYFHHQDLARMGRESVRIERNYGPAETAANVMRMLKG